jgi:hypothetical protein
MARNIKAAPENAPVAFIAQGAYQGERAKIIQDHGSHLSLDISNGLLNLPEAYIVRLKEEDR